MKNLWLLTSVLMVGCIDNVFCGSVKIDKQDAHIKTIVVTFRPETVRMSTREEVDKMIIHLESMLADLKYAKEQMKMREK